MNTCASRVTQVLRACSADGGGHWWRSPTHTSPSCTVIHQPTRLGAACSLLFLGLAGLTAYSLASAPNQSYSTSIVNTLTMGNNVASSDILVTVQGLGIPSTQCSSAGGVAVTADGMVSLLAPNAATDAAFPYPDGVSLVHDNSTLSCSVHYACRRCMVAGKSSVVASVPWNWQVMTWEVSTRSERASGRMVGAIAAPHFLAPDGATVALSIVPTFLVVKSSDGVPSHLVTPEGILAPAAATSTTSHSSSTTSSGSRVVSSGHVLTFRSGSVRSVPVEEAQVEADARTSVTVERRWRTSLIVRSSPTPRHQSSALLLY